MAVKSSLVYHEQLEMRVVVGRATIHPRTDELERDSSLCRSIYIARLSSCLFLKVSVDGEKRERGEKREDKKDARGEEGGLKKSACAKLENEKDIASDLDLLFPRKEKKS